MPDLTELHSHPPAHAERQFTYNKWFIKPELRLTRKPISQRNNNTLAHNTPLSYEALYSHD
jgi:hypothetical protein